MKFIRIALLAGVIAGCSASVGRLTIASTKPIPQDFQVVARNVRGKDCGYKFFFIPFGKRVINPLNALDDALNRAPSADALVNVQVEEQWIVTVILNRDCYVVRGDAVHLPSSQADR
jgi:hypothetical protein